jgi:hypothetical protein
MSSLRRQRFQASVTALAKRAQEQNPESVRRSCLRQLPYKVLRAAPRWCARFPALAPRSCLLRLLLRAVATLAQAHMWLRSLGMVLQSRLLRTQANQPSTQDSLVPSNRWSLCQRSPPSPHHPLPSKISRRLKSCPWASWASFLPHPARLIFQISRFSSPNDASPKANSSS